ncbi:BLUF domain-containing protein, partial [Hymenobacter sp. IS2118]|uniref:BLUF domain-containing protein n=1 Tax=Hymenobacter sp. IS2118 TaxID=1505605 RepID=UPI0005529345
MLAPLPLYRLVYRSKSSVEMHEKALAGLLRQARLHNQSANLTGLLLYAQGRFLQVLEGPEPALSDLYARIKTDPRH